jgi:DNA-binding CsgD family transcriptional regulator
MASDGFSGPTDFAEAGTVEAESRKGAVERLFAPMADALDRMKQGALIVDADGSVLFANRRADECLAIGDGLGVSDGRLRAEAPGQADGLRRLITAAAREGASRAVGMMAMRRRCKRPLVVLVATCHARTSLAAAAGPKRAVLVFITDPERGAAGQSDVLRELYRLTRMEAEVSLALLRGEELQAIADSLAMPVGTVRAHLQTIFDKTETRRQAELIDLLVRSSPDTD